MLSFTGKNIENKVFGIHSYKKWLIKFKAKIPKIDIIFIFFKLKKSPLLNNMVKILKKMNKKKEIGNFCRILLLGCGIWTF